MTSQPNPLPLGRSALPLLLLIAARSPSPRLQEFVDIPEHVHTMALLVQVAKKGTPLFRETAHLVNPYPIAALHHLVEHLADSSE